MKEVHPGCLVECISRGPQSWTSGGLGLDNNNKHGALLQQRRWEENREANLALSLKGKEGGYS